MRAISELTFFTRDLDASVRFYERVLETAPMHRDAGMALFKTGSLRILIHIIMDEGEAGLPFDDHFALSVADVDANADSLKAQGLAMEREPHTYSWGRSAYFRDPDGRLLELHAAQPEPGR